MCIKKTVAVAVAVLSLGAFQAVSAQISAGVSGNFSSNFGGGLKVSSDGTEVVEVTIPHYGGGGGVWLDLIYAEIGVDAVLAGGELKMKAELMGIDQSFDLNYTFLQLGLLGKYPIDLGGITVFPAAGVEYQLCVSVDGDELGDVDDGDFSRLWFKFGAGMDYPISDAMFLRASLLYGIGLENIMEKDGKKEFDFPGVDAETLLSHGLQLKLGLGFNF